jgi:hypothetical protein
MFKNLFLFTIYIKNKILKFVIMKKVSFDFDSTLSREDVQDFASELINLGFDVWVVTSRCSTESALAKGWWWVKKQNKDLYDVCDNLGISKEKIVFTEHVNKIDFLKDKDFLFHLDDDELELEFIEESGDSCQGVWVELKDWKEKCEKICMKIV